MEKNTGKKVVTQGKHREFYLGWNVATLTAEERCDFSIQPMRVPHGNLQ